MSKESVKSIVEKQNEFFLSNETKNLAFRKEMLKRLQRAIQTNEDKICAAIHDDLGKSKTEAYMTEVAMVYQELKEAIRNVEKWGKPVRVKGTRLTFPAPNYVYSEPYGVTLVLAPWNYPFNLSIMPLIGAMVAGNCVVMKCSKSSKHTADMIKKVLDETFPKNYICCLDADTDYDEVLHHKYDYIFFTGSPNVGKKIMQAASENLTPISLELGGKSPCIVDKTANLELAAKRIVWGKFLNAGQTCIAIDYVVIDNQVKEKFIQLLNDEIQKRYANAENRDDYPNIINQHHYERLCALIDTESKVIGGKKNAGKRKIAPAILPNSDFNQEIMQDEIFGPLLPVIGYDDLTSVIKMVKSRPKPLACYIFSEDKSTVKQLISEISYGGGCVNDVLLQITNHHMPFGGVGLSGMGGYHGKHSFDTFSHKKGVVQNTSKIDIGLRYAPYSKEKLKTLKRLL